LLRYTLLLEGKCMRHTNNGVSCML
jgi:hypothetical protein